MLFPIEVHTKISQLGSMSRVITFIVIFSENVH